MLTILNHLRMRYLSQRAQGIVEYALILAFVVGLAAYMSDASGMGGAIQGVFDKVTSALNGSSGGSSGGTTGN